MFRPKRAVRVWILLTSALILLAAIVCMRNAKTNDGEGRKLYEKLSLFGENPGAFEPSEAPSNAPSASPSDVPTQMPSNAPSISPSSSPSSEPSAQPSSSPSSFPSAAPSDKPSVAPSVSPSSLPSAFPSVGPSKAPSALPSVSPSVTPSLSPAPSVTRTSSPSSAPTNAPSTRPTEPPSNGPSLAPSVSPTSHPSNSPTRTPSQKPSTSPSSRPTASPSSSPSSLPSQSPTDFFAETVFYAIADLPYNAVQKRKMPGLIASIPQDADFLIHLGDIKSSSAPCDNTTFSIVEGIVRKSPVPAFFVVGDNEWNDCKGNKDAALRLWRDMFVRFDSKYWNHDLGVTTMPDRPESFTFINRGTLFIGLNLVGSPVVNWTEWNNRTRTQLDWTIDLIEQRRSGDMAIGAIVIFAHANLDGKHRLFVDPLVAYVKDVLQNSIPIMYIGGDNHSWLYEPDYKSQSSFLRVRKTGGTKEPALRIVVNPSAGRFGNDFGTKASTTDAFQLTRFPTNTTIARSGRDEADGGIASEDLDDDIYN